MESDFPEKISEEFDQPRIRFLKDPIHNYIPISHLLSRFIDTQVFQRLRGVKQLGTSSYVWPGASHTRFEHSIGVAHLARSMAEHLQKTQPELNITKRDVNCVEIAGLCHDLGHGPWSHVWDGLFMPVASKDKNWQHEQGSEMMFDHLIQENSVPIPLKDATFVKALIAGDPSKCSPDEKPFLFDIVANKRNGLDVDKFDYIHRDSHMIGDPIHLSLSRIINSAKVLDNQICYDIKDANQLYEICQTRFKLHKLIYNHKAAKSIEYMIIDGLLAAEPYLHIADRATDPKKFLHLTDNIMNSIEASEEPELAAARAIFARIRCRELYKCVDYKVIDWPMRECFRKHVTPEKIVAAAHNLPIDLSTPEQLDDDHDGSTLNTQDVIVDFSIMHYGMKEKNPLDFVKFYSKSNQNRSAKAGPGDYSNLMPPLFAEEVMRVYTKKRQFFGLVQAGYRAILEELERSSTPVPLASNVDPGRLTPPVSEAPSTPRTSSFTMSSSGSFVGTTTTPFSNNSFTTVPPDYAPPSPTRLPRKAKRPRSKDENDLLPGIGSVEGPRKRRGL